MTYPAYFRQVRPSDEKLDSHADYLRADSPTEAVIVHFGGRETLLKNWTRELFQSYVDRGLWLEIVKDEAERG